MRATRPVSSRPGSLASAKVTGCPTRTRAACSTGICALSSSVLASTIVNSSPPTLTGSPVSTMRALTTRIVPGTSSAGRERRVPCRSM